MYMNIISIYCKVCLLGARGYFRRNLLLATDARAHRTRYTSIQTILGMTFVMSQTVMYLLNCSSKQTSRISPCNYTYPSLLLSLSYSISLRMSLSISDNLSWLILLVLKVCSKKSDALFGPIPTIKYYHT